MGGKQKSTPRRAGGPSQRQLRVGEEIRHALARILARAPFNDPLLAGCSFTVTEVRLSPDLKAAAVFVVPLGGGGLDESVAALNRAAAFLRGQLAQEITLRYCPSIAFAPDHSFDRVGQVQAILERPHVKQDLKPAAHDKGDDDGDNNDGP